MQGIDAGIVDENIDSAEALDHIVPKLGGSGRVAKIGGKDLVLGSWQPLEGRLGGVAVAAMVERDSHTAFGELPRDDASRPAGRTRHEGHEVGSADLTGGIMATRSSGLRSSQCAARPRR